MNEPRFDASKVQRTRLIRGISRKELAVRVGVSRQSIYAYEASGSTPRELVALKIAEALDLDPADLWQMAS